MEFTGNERQWVVGFRYPLVLYNQTYRYLFQIAK
jgi:hypothetical protein